MASDVSIFLESISENKIYSTGFILTNKSLEKEYLGKYY
jgi:hypothetical protein